MRNYKTKGYLLLHTSILFLVSSCIACIKCLGAYTYASFWESVNVCREVRKKHEMHLHLSVLTLLIAD